MAAATEDSDDIMKKLLSHRDIEVNAQDLVSLLSHIACNIYKSTNTAYFTLQMGRSALLIACKLGCINAVKLLLATAGVDVNLPDEVSVADFLHVVFRLSHFPH